MNPKLAIAAEPRFTPGAGVRSRILGQASRSTVKPLLKAWAAFPVEILPLNVVDVAARALPLQEGTQWRTVSLPNCRAELIGAAGVDDIHAGNPRVILYFHGGAFLMFGLNTHRRMVTRISQAAGQPVFNVGYRQLPSTPISGSVDDGVDAFSALLGQGYRPHEITVAGDSAGGFLAFAVARKVIDAGLGRPAGVVAISPLLDLDPARKYAHPNAELCQTFPVAAVDRLGRLAHRVELERGLGRPHPSPVDMPLGDMPSTLIHVGSHEVLLPDSELMANRLVAQGVPCDLHVWDRQIHVFHAAAGWLPEARVAIDEIGEFVRNLPTARAPGRATRSATSTPPVHAATS